MDFCAQNCAGGDAMRRRRLGDLLALAGDLNTVPLLNGERSDSLNLWGGPFNNGNLNCGGANCVVKQTGIKHSGTSAYQALLGSVPANNFRFFQTFSSDTNGTPGYRQDRNLTRYSTLQGYVRNDTGVPLNFTLELKDYRDLNSQVAKKSFTIPAGSAWTQVVAPLDISSGWSVTGSPDLSRTFGVGFLVNTDFGASNGSLYLDDFELVEKGPTIDVATAPIHDVVEQLAHRQFDALWTARNKTSGLIPNSSDNVLDRRTQHDYRRRVEAALGDPSRLGHADRRRRLHGTARHLAQYESQSDDVSADAISRPGDGRPGHRP